MSPVIPANPSATPPPYHHGNVRGAALEAVAEAIRADGMAGVTIRSIAAAVGVSHAALYRHVASIDDLLDEAAARFLRSIVGDDPEEEVEAFLRRYVERAVADPHHYRLAFSRPRDGRSSPRTEDALTALRDHAGAVFALGWPDDTRRATMHRVIRTWSTVHGMLDLAGHGLVVTADESALVRYVVSSALRSAAA